MQRLAGAFVPKGGMVLDPFVGSGSTIMGALLSERRVVPGETTPDCTCKVDASWPLPEELSGIGCDFDAEMLVHAARRVKNALDVSAEAGYVGSHEETQQQNEVETHLCNPGDC